MCSPQVLYVFFVLYCYYEGLTQTQDETREVLLYIFHGTYEHKKKDRAPLQKPIIHGKTCYAHHTYSLINTD